jgi:hypothetical protein
MIVNDIRRADLARRIHREATSASLRFVPPGITQSSKGSLGVLHCRTLRQHLRFPFENFTLQSYRSQSTIVFRVLEISKRTEESPLSRYTMWFSTFRIPEMIGSTSCISKALFANRLNNMSNNPVSTKRVAVGKMRQEFGGVRELSIALQGRNGHAISILKKAPHGNSNSY